MRKLTTAQFITRAISVHGDTYGYSVSQYENARTKIKIQCKKCDIIFEQLSGDHFKGCGCPECKKLSQADFISRVTQLHPKLDFSKTKYINALTKISFKCLTHGEMKTIPGILMKGHGCKECAVDMHRENPTGWSYSSWINKAKHSNYFRAFQVYIIECWDNSTNERFIKIGKTFRSINLRFGSSVQLPYDFKVIKIIESEDGKEICELEKRLQKQCEKYIPSKPFEGMYECFTSLPEHFH